MNYEIVAQTVKKITNQKIMIAIPDEIGSWWGLAANDVKTMLNGADVTEIIIPISCFGGGVLEAFEIGDLLRAHPAKKIGYLTGKCMSAGTIIASMCDEVYSTPHCIYMIHKAIFSNTGGNADELKKDIALLEKYDVMISDVLAKKTGMKATDILDLMKVESYFMPSEALALGFIDGIVDVIPYDFQFPNDVTYVQPQTTGYGDYSWLWNKIESQNLPQFKGRNYGPINQADLSKFEAKRTSLNVQNQSVMNFWDIVKVFIPTDRQAEAKKAIDAQNNAQLNEITNSVKNAFEEHFEERAKDFAKASDVKAFDFSTLKAAIDAATDGEKADMLASLGYTAPEEVEATEPEAIENNATVKNILAELDVVKKQVVKIVNIKPTNPTNGGALVSENEGEKELSDRGKSQLQFLKNQFQAGQLPKDIYDAQVAKLK
jgi:ATP-dependent protease ClpP protease subunit